ncbi:MAG: hypothetical protein F6K54_31960 [Okeania sp. SIO3B5]|uniref:hypothetical protein n=1 Tax=Okeania sp. SIO3B5 TaxID=2607811 RepID=UPI0013FF450F|nr:hypothetical protein [Okeania sp. SIO3B5]NEO57281.1 hypothetical protein [Okeania sp. SIO3B5]
MNTTNTTLSPEPDLVKDNWELTEVWIDPTLSPPYILLLLSATDGRCRIYDPAEGYRTIFESDNYDDAQFWLLEDEYEPLEGRLNASELI